MVWVCGGIRVVICVSIHIYEHKHRLFVLTGAQISDICAPGSTNKQCLCSEGGGASAEREGVPQAYIQRVSSFVYTHTHTHTHVHRIFVAPGSTSKQCLCSEGGGGECGEVGCSNRPHTKGEFASSCTHTNTHTHVHLCIYMSYT